MTLRAEHLAYHEAGHAVVRHHCRHAQRVMKVSIVGTGHSAVRARWRGVPKAFADDWSISPPPKQLAIALDEMTVAYGGPVAEARFRGRWDRYNAISDQRAALAYAKWFGHDENAMLRWARRRAEDLVDRHWWLVEAVAGELLQRKTLRGGEFNQVVAAASAAHQVAKSVSG